MNTRRVPLRVVVDGVKQTIGEAVVDTDDGYFDVSATVTDPEWRKKLTQEHLVSLHFEPCEVRRGDAVSVHIPDITMHARVPFSAAVEWKEPK